MSVGINTYASPEIAQSDIALPATLTISEVDLFVLTDQRHIHKSQITVYGAVTLGAVTSATFYYYVSPDGTNWYPISFFPSGYAAAVNQRSCIIDSTTYSTGGKSMFEDDIGASAFMSFKITGKSSSGTPTLNALKVLTRDN